MATEMIPGALSRAYSFDVEGRMPPDNVAHELALLYSRNDDDSGLDPWRALFTAFEPGEDDEALDPLKDEARQLTEYFDEFQRRLPAGERVEYARQPPNMRALVEMVTTTSASWQKKRTKGVAGRCMTYFHKFCDTLSAHSNLIKVIPQGNTYVSLFSGVLTAVIQASVNHESVAKSLAEALESISEHIAACARDVELYRTKIMQEAIADLYAHIFLFLQDTMKWYLRRKGKGLLDSFNEKLHEHFADEIANIRNKSDVIRREAGRSQGGEIRVARIMIEQTHRDLRVGLTGLARREMDRSYENKRIEKALDCLNRNSTDFRNDLTYLRRCVQQLLDQNEHVYQHQRQHDLAAIADSGSRSAYPLLMPREGTHSKQDPYSCTNIDVNRILDISKGLERYFHRDRVRIFCDPQTQILVDPEAMMRLREWTQNEDCGILSIAGASSMYSGVEDPMTWLAAKFINFVGNTELRMISYFCRSQWAGELRPGNSPEMQAALELVYSIIRQTIEHLPPTVDLAANLSEGRFSALDGTVGTWEAAISLLHDLLACFTGKPMFCVIDGFQYLDDMSTELLVAKLVAELRMNRLKVLLTTTGRSRSLLGELDRSELLLVDQSRRRNKMTSGFM